MQQRPANTDHIPQAVTAALLEARKGTCSCNTCVILRQVADAMSLPFIQPTTIVPQGGPQ